MDGRWARLGVALALAGMVAVGGGMVRARWGGSAPIDGTYGGFVQQLAGRVGVRPAELGRAMQEVAVTTLAGAVKEGRLTAPQAQLITKTLREGRWPLPVEGEQTADTGSLGLIARALGLEPGELNLRLHGGQTIAQIAGERGVPLADVQAILLDQLTAQLDRAIFNGQLSPERKAELLAQMGQHVDFFLNTPLRAWGGVVSPIPRQTPGGGGPPL